MHSQISLKYPNGNWYSAHLPDQHKVAVDVHSGDINDDPRYDFVSITFREEDKPTRDGGVEVGLLNVSKGVVLSLVEQLIPIRDAYEEARIYKLEKENQRLRAELLLCKTVK